MSCRPTEKDSKYTVLESHTRKYTRIYPIALNCFRRAAIVMLNSETQKPTLQSKPRPVKPGGYRCASLNYAVELQTERRQITGLTKTPVDDNQKDAFRSP
jgi:hypothetical protein